MKISNGLLLVLVFATTAASCSLEESTIESEVGNGDDCVFTQGYWKNHAEAWPVSTLVLGTVSYSQAQLLEILRTPVRGNGLISLAHQLIAAKLNVANGG